MLTHLRIARAITVYYKCNKFHHSYASAPENVATRCNRFSPYGASCGVLKKQQICNKAPVNDDAPHNKKYLHELIEFSDSFSWRFEQLKTHFHVHLNWSQTQMLCFWSGVIFLRLKYAEATVLWCLLICCSTTMERHPLAFVNPSDTENSAPWSKNAKNSLSFYE